jgi:LmbE family N-acetylglucosaminyl deacetylase
MLHLELSFSKGNPLEVLCLGAHPDDIEIGCGGTILKMCQERPDLIVHWVVLGAHGRRQDEARKGAALFRDGAAGGDVVVRDFRDGYFPYEGGAIKELFEGLKSAISPDLIFTHYRDDRHQDHRTVSDLTWNTWRDHLILEYEVPKWDGDLAAPNAFSPLPSTLAHKKTESVLTAFGSQKEKDWFTGDTFLGLMRLRGLECRAEDGFAEAFFARKMVTDL